MLRLLLRSGADPLAFGGTSQHPDPAVRGRAGPLPGFFLTCRSPLLLGVAVRHVLQQCREGSRVLAPTSVAQLCLAAHLAGPPLANEAEQLLAQVLLQGNCFPRAGYAPAPRAHSSCPGPAGKESGGAPEPTAQRQCRASGGGAGPSSSSRPNSASATQRHDLAHFAHMRVEAVESDDEAGPSSRFGSQHAAAPGSPPLFPGSPHRLRRDWLLSLRLRRQQGAGVRGGAEEREGLGEAGGARAAPDARAAWQRGLRAQLVADAALHGATDLLEVLLG